MANECEYCTNIPAYMQRCTHSLLQCFNVVCVSPFDQKCLHLQLLVSQFVYDTHTADRGRVSQTPNRDVCSECAV